MVFKLKHWQALSLLSILAAILYNSWPLGYWLNPVVAKTELASGLEATGQPYNWLFITTDIISSLMVIAVAWLIWRKLKSAPQARILAAALIFLVIFGVGTIVDAALPEPCQPGIGSCQSWQHDPALLAHGVFSILAAFALFLSLVIVWWRHRKNTILNGLMLGYIISGAITLAEALLPGKDGNWSQQYNLTLCSLWIAFTPYVLNRSFNRSSQAENV